MSGRDHQRREEGQAVAENWVELLSSRLTTRDLDVAALRVASRVRASYVLRVEYSGLDSPKGFSSRTGPSANRPLSILSILEMRKCACPAGRGDAAAARGEEPDD